MSSVRINAETFDTLIESSLRQSKKLMTIKRRIEALWEVNNRKLKELEFKLKNDLEDASRKLDNRNNVLTLKKATSNDTAKEDYRVFIARIEHKAARKNLFEFEETYRQVLDQYNRTIKQINLFLEEESKISESSISYLSKLKQFVLNYEQLKDNY